MVDCIAIPHRIKGSAFQFGSQISSIASECLVGFLNPASKDTMAPLQFFQIYNLLIGSSFGVIKSGLLTKLLNEKR